MGAAAQCPRCGGEVRPPDMSVSAWRCPNCGPVPPMRAYAPIGDDVLESVTARVAGGPRAVPVWCPWPLPTGWLVTGIAWVGDERDGAHAAALALAGPAPLHGGPADVMLIAEVPGVGLGNRYAGIAGVDPGPALAAVTSDRPHAKIKADGRDTPMWTIAAGDDRVAYVGEARGMWLYVVAWPADAGYLLSEDIVLHDLTSWQPRELVYGAPSPYLFSAG